MSNGAKRSEGVSTIDGKCLVLVGPEGRGKDLLIASARRRFSADSSIEFPERISTRPGNFDSEQIHVSRSAFRDLEASGALFASWRADGHGVALPGSVALALASGRTVVFAASSEVAAGLRAHGLAVTVIEVTAGPDCVRARAATRRSSAAGETSARASGDTVVLHHGADLADAVRRFHALLLASRLERLAVSEPQPLNLLRDNARRMISRARPVKSRQAVRQRA